MRLQAAVCQSGRAAVLDHCVNRYRGQCSGKALAWFPARINASITTEDWRRHGNEVRASSSLGSKTREPCSKPLLVQEPRQVRPEWNRLAELGFDAQGFGFAVAALSDGAFVDALRRLPLHAPGGAVVPLEAVALVPPGMAVDVSGAEFYRGLGVVVLSGLLFSTVVTLTFLPALLVQVLEWRRRRAARPSAGSPSP